VVTFFQGGPVPIFREVGGGHLFFQGEPVLKNEQVLDL